ncbi:MAG: T9SS type A sorting domain-containing protein [Cryomorphaceae bacterium]|nr:T9SS type A sorting domain-containing protein [Cryomorphaceae bacterium]
MKKSLLLFPITIALAIFFYPTTSHSNSGGSPGGKTNSPLDAQTCTGCHSGTLNSGVGTASITSDIPVNGYVIGNTYTITLTGVKANCTKFGFELTAEDASGKAGNFMITDNTTKFVNSNNAVSHKSSGNSGNTTKSWSVDWMPTANSSNSTTFYAALMFANGNGNNNGDYIFTTSLTVNEEIVNAVNDLSLKNDFTFNTVNKTIETTNAILVYDINGKLVLTTKEKSTTISHLKNGIYILKSENKTQKIILN